MDVPASGLKVAKHATDAEEYRLPLHRAIRQALAMDLRSPD